MAPGGWEAGSGRGWAQTDFGVAPDTAGLTVLRQAGERPLGLGPAVF